MNSFDLFGYHLINRWAGHIPFLGEIRAVGKLSLYHLGCFDSLRAPLYRPALAE